jgi:Flp pilus assembly protein TadD
MRLNPLDSMSCVPQGIIGFGNFLLGRYDEATTAGRKAVELNPRFSILHAWLAAPLVKLGRLDEAREYAARLLALDPQFSVSRWSNTVGIAPAVAEDLHGALHVAGLPG